jgi:metallo-beta-lactamase class B
VARRLRPLAALAAALAAAPLGAQPAARGTRGMDPTWLEPIPAFRVADNLYYVGSRGLASYLVATPQGHVLINSSLEESVPLIRASVESLGFKFSDVKVLLISHAHADHDAGSAAVKALTGATYMVMDGDVPVVESGGKEDFGSAITYPATTVDRVLHDGDEVRLGGAVLVAHLTPGHTKGCTTWTLRVQDGARVRDVVIVGSPNVNPGYRLVDNAKYPRIADDFARTFRVMASLPADIFLGAHGSYFGLDGKLARLKAGAPSPFSDAEGYRRYVAEREGVFRAELAKQQQGAPRD